MIHPLWSDRRAIDRAARRIGQLLEHSRTRMAVLTGHPYRPWCPTCQEWQEAGSTACRCGGEVRYPLPDCRLSRETL